MVNEQLLTTKELQKRLGVGRDRAYQLMHSKGFPSIKIGARYYVTKDALTRWLKMYAYREYQL
ncbi:MAG: helix-turn-helix domain-containing protein [Lachnospiraceae bacterium]|nr:helix-turn-helix domain-containing protein [Lachnospiraceae bacterium]